MVELHNASMKNAFLIAGLHHIPFSSDFNNGCEKRVSSNLRRLTDAPHSQLWREHIWAHRRQPIDEYLNHCPCLGCPPHDHMAFFSWTATPPIPPSESSCIGPGRFALRAIFCAWCLHRCVDNPEFPGGIIFTDEALFNREAVLNCRNSHIWDDANPHTRQPRAFQERFGINVWANIIDGNLIGPYVLPYHLTGPRYLIFHQEILVELLEDLPLALRQHPCTFHVPPAKISTKYTVKGG